MGGKAVNPTPHRTFRIADRTYHRTAQAVALDETDDATLTAIAAKALDTYADERAALLDAARAVTEPCVACGQPIYEVKGVWYHLATWAPACDSRSPSAESLPRKRGRRTA